MPRWPRFHATGSPAAKYARLSREAKAYRDLVKEVFDIFREAVRLSDSLERQILKRIVSKWDLLSDNKPRAENFPPGLRRMPDAVPGCVGDQSPRVSPSMYPSPRASKEYLRAFA